MKNVLKFFVPMAAAVIATLASCVKEDKAPEANVLNITVHAIPEEIQGEPQAVAQMKTYINSSNAILWGTGEYMKIGVNSGSTTVFDNSTDESADIFAGEAEALFNFSVSISAEAPYTYYGMYPASAAVVSSNTAPASYKVNLPAVQNASASSYDPKAYILVAKPEGDKTAASDDWQASFRRAAALNKVTLKNIPSGKSIKRVKFTAPEGTYLAGGRHIDLTTGLSGDIYSGGGRTETIEVKFDTPLTGSGVNNTADVWFTSWNMDLGEGDTFTVVIYTTDKKSYTKEITIPSGRKIQFIEGCLNSTTVGFSGITPEDVTEMEEGDYVVLAKDGNNYYALKAEKEENKERLLSVAYDGGLDSYYGDADIIWHLTESGESFIFENSDKYLGYKGSDNASYWLEPDASWTETNYLLDVTAQETAGLYHVTLHSTGRYLSKNSSAAFFAFYGNTGQKADIVFVPATVDTRAVVSLSFAEESLSYTTSNYGQCSGQTATASPNVSAITSAITYAITSDDDDVISSLNTSTGAVALSGNTGTATVTASYPGDVNTYRPASASYTIVVSSPSGSQYELVSAANDVVAGDYIITWNNSYYLVSGSTSGTNPAVGTGITVANNKITNTVTSDMVWTFTGDNTNGFTISDGTNILHSTNAAQGISITTNSTRKWTASVDGTYGMLLHGDDGGSRNLAVYNSATWRYYTTGNSYTGKLRLYKLVDNRENPGMSWSAASATAVYGTGNILSFTAPTLTPGAATGITYSSSDATIASINAAGVVTIAALSGNTVKTGSTTISAIFAGDDDYKAQTVTYTLTVEDNRAQVATPTFSPAAGEVAADTEVSFNCTDADVAFHYTVNGSDPTVDSPTATSVTIDANKTVKVLATKTGYKPSAVASAAYTIAGASYDFETVAELNSLVTSSSASYNGYLTNAVVSFVPATGTAFVKDATGSVMFYKSNHGLLQGQTFTGAIEVTAVKFSSLYSEVTAWDATFTGSQTTVAPQSVTLAELSGHYDDYQNAYVSVAGLTVTSLDGTNNKNIHVTDGTNSYVVYYNPGNPSCGVDDVITAVGTITKYSNTEEIKVWAAADITVTGSAPKAITFSQPASGGTFTVTAGGNTINSGDTVASGTTVTLTATPATDYAFSSWTVSGATVADASAATTTFTMGTSAVTVSASFTSTSGGGGTPTALYTADFEGDNEHRTSGNNSYTSNNYTVSGVAWNFTYADVISNAALQGSYNCTMRSAKKTNNCPSFTTGNVLSASATITKVTFQATFAATYHTSHSLEYSIDGGTTWNSLTDAKDTDVNSSNGYSANLSNVTTSDLRFRFTVTCVSHASVNSTCDSRFDNLIVYGY